MFAKIGTLDKFVLMLFLIFQLLGMTHEIEISAMKIGFN